MRRIDPALLLGAYAQGIFPMAERADDPSVYWVEPKIRAVLPLSGFRVSRSLRKTLHAARFEVTHDRAFGELVALCAEVAADRPATWINGVIADSYGALFALGFAHSIECWREGKLVGGVYGVSLGRAFFGESMVSRRRDASKVALAHLVARLCVGGWQLFDCQYMTAHLASLGAVEMVKADYIVRLHAALSGSAANGNKRSEGTRETRETEKTESSLPPLPLWPFPAGDWEKLDRLAAASMATESVSDIHSLRAGSPEIPVTGGSEIPVTDSLGGRLAGGELADKSLGKFIVQLLTKTS